jgi:DNA-binding NarL/FixJ family response regulator
VPRSHSAQIVQLIAEGLSYTRIAEQLNLSAHTVTTHRRNVMQKLGVNSTAAVVMYAVKNGLVSPNRYLFEGRGDA